MFGVARLALFAANPAPAAGGASGGKSYFFGGFSGSTLTTVRSYNLVSGTSATGTALPAAAFVHAAFGSGTRGFATGGYTGSSPASYSRYFTFADDTANSWTWTATPTLPATQRNHRGASSSTKGYSWGGYRDGAGDQKLNYQFTYSTNTWATATALPFTGSPLQASHASVHSNSTYGIWVGGVGDGTSLNYKQRMIYTWSDDTSTYTANGADYTHWLSATTGDQTNMVVIAGIRGGSLTTATTKYNISSGAVSSGGSVGTAFSHADAAGDDSVGIAAGNSGSPTIANAENAYTYATDTATLLSAYLSNNQAMAAETESLAACHSIQIS